MPGQVRPPPDTPRPRNRLLARLPAADFERIRPHLTTIAAPARKVFHKSGEPVRQIFFPNGGVASVTASMSDGTMVEVATVGDEGLVGISALFADSPMAVETMMQVADTDAEMMPVDAFRREFELRGAFHDAVSRYSQGFLGLLMQSTACMALHQVQERCARWLLMTHDRVRQDEFDLSQEFLAMMLGSTRPTVSVVAGILQQAGLIKYKHGHITIVDRKALETSACECYATVRSTFDRLHL